MLRWTDLGFFARRTSEHEWKGSDAFLEMIFRELTHSGSFLQPYIKHEGEFGATLLNLEKSKVEWKQQRDIRGLMSHRSLLQNSLIQACWAADWPRGVCMETLYCTRCSFLMQNKKIELCLCERGNRLPHTIFKYSISFYFSKGLTTRVNFFKGEEFLTLAPLWKCVSWFFQSKDFTFT